MLHVFVSVLFSCDVSAAVVLQHCYCVIASTLVLLQVEGEVALNGLESLTTPDVLSQLLRVLVSSLAEQCRLACACVFVPRATGGSKRCRYIPGVAAECLGRSSQHCSLTPGKCRGRLFPCHIPALQAAADDLQRHAVAHATTASAAAYRNADAALAWVPPLELLAACMRCEYIFSAAAALCRVFGSEPPALAIVNRTLHQLLRQLQQQVEAAAAAGNNEGQGGREGGKGSKLPEAECDILVPLLSCSEKQALQRMLVRFTGSSETSEGAAATAAAPWDVSLPWPPFAQEYVFLLLSHAGGAQQQPRQHWRFYFREQHGDRAFAVATERPFS